MNYFKDLMWVPTIVQGGGGIGTPICLERGSSLTEGT
jgi:hypothetical protein